MIISYCIKASDIISTQTHFLIDEEGTTNIYPTESDFNISALSEWSNPLVLNLGEHLTCSQYLTVANNASVINFVHEILL